MIITALKQTSNERITVCFSDGCEVNSTLGVVTDMRLYCGKDIDEDSFILLKESSAKYLALNKAAELASRRMISGKELYDKLIQKSYSEEIADFCVNKLTDAGLINDEQYAYAIVRHYYAKSYGVGRIKDELWRRGIDRDLWDDALKQLPDTDEKIDHYISTHLSDPTDQKQIQKVSNSLFRRGYSWDEIKSAMRRYEQ